MTVQGEEEEEEEEDLQATTPMNIVNQSTKAATQAQYPQQPGNKTNAQAAQGQC